MRRCGNLDQRLGCLHLEVVILAEAAIAAKPGEAALHDPGQALDLESALASFGDDEPPPFVFPKCAGRLTALVAVT